MATVKASFSGNTITLPSNVQLVGSGEVTLTLPDEAVAPASHAKKPSIWDVLKNARPTGRTVEDVNRQIREDRDAWVDPHDRLKGRE